MNEPRFKIGSSIGKKLLNGLTGLALMGFVVAHLAGNLTLLFGSNAFNTYSESIARFGFLVYVAEVGLLALIVAHAVSAIIVWNDKRSARSTRNSVEQSKGPPSKQTVFSRSMIVTGLVLLVFLVIHIWQFRFGAGISQGYVTTVHGEPARDLYRLVVETFRSPIWVGFYTAVMILLGMHLRHGFWSAFQSIGALNPSLRPLAYSAGAVFAVLIAVGFLILPLVLFFTAPDAMPPSVAMGLRP